MNLLTWALSLLCLFPGSRVSTFDCDSEDLCVCYSEDFEIHCPTQKDKNLIIHFDEKNSEIQIDCPLSLETFHLQQLPNVAIDARNFRMRFCAWPQEEFLQILNRFSLKRITFLEFSTSSSENILLTDYYFKGLEEIHRLKLSQAGISDLDENVFANTPNLRILELNDNNITLKRNLFRNVPLLTFLDLSGNNLEDIPPEVFKPLKNLETIHLWNNKLRKLDGQHFKDLTGLRSLEISINRIDEISENTFIALENLEQVNLSANKLKELPPDLFRHNKNLRLVKMKSNFHLKLSDHLFANLSVSQVDLSHCRLKSIPEDIFQNCYHLKIVKLERNQLKSLPDGLFQGLRNLEHIRLQYNRIQSVSQTFRGLRGLKSLHLQNNFIGVLNSEDFADLTHLERINLKGNGIRVIEAGSFDHKDHLQVINLSHNFLNSSMDRIITLDSLKSLISLDLTHNAIQSLKLSDLKPVTNVTIRLDHNLITVVDLENVKLYEVDVRISLAHNPIECDCRNFQLVEYFKKRTKEEFSLDISMKNLRCGGPPELKDLSVVTLPSLLTCRLQNRCPERCSCAWRPFDKTLVIDCSYKNLTEFPEIDLSQIAPVGFNQTELNLEGNHLTVVDGNSTGYHNITGLFLSGNKIRTVKNLPEKLKVLTLDSNDLTHLNYDVLKTLTGGSLINLTLHGNPWRCDCGSEFLADFLRTSTQVHITNVVCEDGKFLIDLKRDDFCNQWENAHFILVMLSVLLVLSICGVIYHSRKHQIKVWLFSNNLCLWWVTEQELDKTKQYDAFLSYSHNDEDFVREELLPVLDTTYKLCVHYRDWIPGELITTQITNSVLESRRTVVILSRNFLESVWGRMEFRTAHSEAISEGRTRVIVVLLEDLNVDDLDDELQMYLKTNTYLKWNDARFWDKLAYALPHKKIRRRRLFSEDCSLIQSNPSSPGCTPPISVNTSFTRINPSTFVRRQNDDA